MSSASIPTLPTVGEIARRTGKAVHCVDYVIRTRGIKPIGARATRKSTPNLTSPLSPLNCDGSTKSARGATDESRLAGGE